VSGGVSMERTPHTQPKPEVILVSELTIEALKPVVASSSTTSLEANGPKGDVDVVVNDDETRWPHIKKLKRSTDTET
jgi:hypothetical protein